MLRAKFSEDMTLGAIPISFTQPASTSGTEGDSTEGQSNL